MKQFFLSLFLAILGFSSLAQVVPDSNACVLDLVVTNQGYDYTVEAVPVGNLDPTTLTYSWTIDGLANTAVTGNTYTFTAVVGSTPNICVTIPCDTNFVEFCTSLYIDSLGNNNPIDSTLFSCLQGINNTSFNYDGYLSVEANFDGYYYDPNNISWSIDGVTDTTLWGANIFASMAPGTYIVCATYTSDSCIATYCDSFVVTDPLNPIDSLDMGCLIGITTYSQGGYLTAVADFDGMLFDAADLTWSIDGVVDPTLQGDYISMFTTAGTYYVCATYDSDSCTVTFCDSVVVTDPMDPNDSLNTSGCLEYVTEYHVGGQYFFTAEFENQNGFLSDVVWTVDGVVASGVNGPYFTQVFADGDYTICASYTTDSCANEICIDITVDNSVVVGNDSIIYIDSIGFGDWIIDNWDSIYVDSLLWDEINDWDPNDWSDSLIDIIFGDSLNINDFDSNDIYVLLDGLTQDEIDSLLAMGVAGFDLDDLDDYWEDFLDDNEDLGSGDITFNDLLNLFGEFMGAKASEVLSVDEVEKAEVDVFFNPHTNVLTINSDNVGLVNVYNVQGQRVLSQNMNTPQLNLSTINTGLYILSIEIDGKLYSHKLVK